MKKARFKFAGVPSALLMLMLALGLLPSPRGVSAAAEDKITGTIKLDGQAPYQEPIDMSKEPGCQQLQAGHPVTTESVVVGANQGLQNVVVYISDGLSVAAANEVSSDTPTFNQKGCQYIPHVLALDVNQHFQVANSDPHRHTIHPIPKPNGSNHEWNRSQPPGTPPFDQVWAGEEVAIPVKCNIHPWMHGYMAVVKGPYAVSDSNGSFTINNVPPGNYTVTAWQETYGSMMQKVTVGAGKPATADFTFKVSWEPGVTQQEGQSSPSVELKEGQTPQEVEKVLGKPNDTMTVKGSLIYIYPTVKVIFENGKLADVQYKK